MLEKSRFYELWCRTPRGVRTAATAVLMLAALDSFFVSIKLLSAFKALGSGYGHDLIVDLASNPIIGLLIGILVTSVVQSSSSTTSLVVGLVAAGALGEDPAQAVRITVPIIMGANVGTSVTNSLVSFGHIGDRREFQRAFAAATVHDFFNLLAVIVLLPIQMATNFLGHSSLRIAQSLEETGGLAFASPLKLLVNPQLERIIAITNYAAAARFVVLSALAIALLHLVRNVAERAASQRSSATLNVFAGVAIGGVCTGLVGSPNLLSSPEIARLCIALTGMFGALYVMVKIMRGVVVSRAERLFHGYVFKTPIRAFALGLLFTALVQSSSVTTSLIVPLAGAGFVQLIQVFPYTLGANLGTTVTAMLAALSLGEPTAVAVATAHLLFNILGIVILYPVRQLPLRLAQRMAAVSARWPPAAAIFVVTVFFAVPLSLIFIVR